MAAERIQSDQHKPDGQFSSQPKKEKRRPERSVPILRALFLTHNRDDSGAAHDDPRDLLYLPDHGKGLSTAGGRRKKIDFLSRDRKCLSRRRFGRSQTVL